MSHAALLAALCWNPDPPFVISRLNLGVCVEELEQGHGERLNGNVATLVLLDVVGHGLSLCLCQQQIGLLLQRTPSPHKSWGKSRGHQALTAQTEDMSFQADFRHLL